MTPSEIKKAVEPYSTAAVEPGEDGLFSVSTSDGQCLAHWVPSKQDAQAIMWGLKMYACAMTNQANSEQRIEAMAREIMRLSKEASEKGYHAHG